MSMAYSEIQNITILNLDLIKLKCYVLKYEFENFNLDFI